MASVYGDGLGTLVMPVRLLADLLVSLVPQKLHRRFQDQWYGFQCYWFTASDIDVTGGAVSNFTAVSGSQYTFTVTAQTVPSDVTVRVPDGAATDSNGRDTIANLFATDFTSGRKPKAWLPGGKWMRKWYKNCSGSWCQIHPGRPQVCLI